MDRSAFLATVCDAARAGRAYRVHVRPLPPNTGYVGAEGDHCTRLAEEIELVGGRAHPVEDLAGARRVLTELLAEYAVQSAICWQHPLLDRVGMPEVLAERGATRLDHAALSALGPDEARIQQLAAEICISSCDYAIAETGSLVVCARPGQERLASLIAPVHVAIVERDQILPDLFDVFDRLEAAGLDRLPSNIALITGPSKTGDIELQLTTGVHGPGKWHVIVISGK